jgi:hypothetical protein
VTWTDPRTWVTDEVVTSSQLNTHVRDNLLSVQHAHGRENSQKGPVNTTSETSLYTTAPVIAANSLGSTGSFYAFHAGIAKQGVSSSGGFTIRVKFGGSAVISQTWGDTLNAGSEGYWMIQVFLENLSATNSQRVVLDINSSVNRMAGFLYHATAAVDTTSAQTFDVTIQPGTASNDMYVYSQFRKHLLAQN